MSNGLYNFARSAANAVFKLPYRLSAIDNESVPAEGGLIICANHTGLMDAVFIAALLKRQLTFMAKKELFSFRPFGCLLKKLGAFPIDRGNNDVAAVKASIRLLKSGHAMLIFPQGTRCKKSDNVSAKHGAVRLAIMTGAPILPMYVSEDRKAFRRKAYVGVGKPIDYSCYKGAHLTDEDYDRLCSELMDNIYGLAEGEN